MEGLREIQHWHPYGPGNMTKKRRRVAFIGVEIDGMDEGGRTTYCSN